MTDLKLLLGYISGTIIVIAYIPYIYQVLRGSTRPHLFTWIIWTVLTGTGFAIQLAEGGGSGAWALGASAILCFVVLMLSIFKGEHDIVSLDWLFLFMAMIAFSLWWFAEEPLLSIMLVTLTDAIAYLPTFRKSYHKPYEESMFLYYFGAIAFTLSIFAFSEFTLVNYLYPLVIAPMNLMLVAMILIRRSQILVK